MFLWCCRYSLSPEYSYRVVKKVFDMNLRIHIHISDSILSGESLDSGENSKDFDRFGRKEV